MHGQRWSQKSKRVFEDGLFKLLKKNAYFVLYYLRIKKHVLQEKWVSVIIKLFVIKKYLWWE